MTQKRTYAGVLRRLIEHEAKDNPLYAALTRDDAKIAQALLSFDKTPSGTTVRIFALKADARMLAQISYVPIPSGIAAWALTLENDDLFLGIVQREMERLKDAPDKDSTTMRGFINQVLINGRPEMLDALHAVNPEIFLATAKNHLHQSSTSYKFVASHAATLLRFLRGDVAPETLEKIKERVCFSGDVEDIEDFAATTGVPAADLFRDIRETAIRKKKPVLRNVAAHLCALKIAYDGEDALFERELLWKRVARAYPHSFRLNDPAYFRPQGFAAALRMLAAEGYYTRDTGAGYAFSLSSLFGTEERILEYLERWGTIGPEALHDLAVPILIPERKCDLKLWADAVMQHGPEMAKMVKYADRIAPQRSADGKKYSLNATRAKVALFVYNRAAENPALAKLCHTHQVDERYFNEALDVLSRAINEKNLPEIIIDGTRFDMPGATFSRLPANDVHGPFLGEIVDNCQSLGNVGSRCAEHGVTSPNGGFYVVKKGNKIVAETWAWRGTRGELCFDSLEALNGHISDNQWGKLINAFARELTEDRCHDVTVFTVGTGGRTPRHLSEVFASSAAAEPKDYNGYRDSKKQAALWVRRA